MRFRSDVNASAGALLEIRVATARGCRQVGVGEGVASEVYRRVGALAHLTELEYESLGLGDSLLILHFDGPVDYRIAQRGDLRTVELRVRVGNDIAQQVAPAPVEPTPRPTEPAPRAAPPPTAPSDRAPIRSRVRRPFRRARLRDQSAVDREPVTRSRPRQGVYVSTRNAIATAREPVIGSRVDCRLIT